MWIKYLPVAVAVGVTLGVNVGEQAQAAVPPGEVNAAASHLLKMIKSRPFYALDWHQLKLATSDEGTATRLKEALERSGRSAEDIAEQSLWVEAAAGRPEPALAFYDGNARRDKTLLHTACWARAARGLDLSGVMAACNAAVSADRKSYTLVSRGQAQLQLGLVEAALRDFNEALSDTKFQKHPMLVDAAFGRGFARIRLGDDGGRKDIAAATRADPRVVVRFADIGINP